ncbi:hypothetical protein CEXT_597011 [Caerostris extrusa]|uniref:Uncharacterized protein n=1 Tax=Caerostris extrusa TaxID=172846 RepID=A0AAV4UI14_CAEEX|nr:hypothetical protein CEXT_597011 [Caerostris extrusa]
MSFSTKSFLIILPCPHKNAYYFRQVKKVLTITIGKSDHTLLCERERKKSPKGAFVCDTERHKLSVLLRHGHSRFPSNINKSPKRKKLRPTLCASDSF